MKLLVNAISAKQGGIVTYTRNMIRWMAEHGIDATFAVPHSFEASGSNIIRESAGDYSAIRRVVWEQSVWPRIVAKHKPNILFSSANFGLLRSPVPQVLLLREGGLFDDDYLANFAPEQGVRTAALRFCRRQLMLASAAWSDAVVTPSKTMRDLILTWRPRLKEKISVCSYGTRPDMFGGIENRSWRADGVLRAIYVSVYYPHKNPAVVAQAVRAICDAGLPAHATITMKLEDIETTAGGIRDSIFLRSGLEDGTLTLGAQRYEDLPRLYAGHDVFVFPSLSESFGHPMVEAMSVGLPVIAADTRINREICGEAALYFPAFHSSALAALLRKLDNDPDLRSRLTEAGRQRAKELYPWDAHMKQLLTVFESVFKASKQRASGSCAA